MILASQLLSLTEDREVYRKPIMQVNATSYFFKIITIGSGVPLVVIPIIFDQARNAYQVKRNKLGVVVHKTELSEEGPLEKAIREVLENPE